MKAYPAFVRIDNVFGPGAPRVTLSCGHVINYNGSVNTFKVGAPLLGWGCTECNAIPERKTPGAWTTELEAMNARGDFDHVDEDAEAHHFLHPDR